MANSKISALTAATAPLAGTDVLPIVQSTSTVKATIANVQAAPITAGTANAVMYLNGSKVPTTGTSLAFDGTNLGVVGRLYAGTGSRTFTTSFGANVVLIHGDNTSGTPSFEIINNTQYGGVTPIMQLALTSDGAAVPVHTLNTAGRPGDLEISAWAQSSGGGNLRFYAGNAGAKTLVGSFDTSYNFNVSAGNVVQGTAAKGFDFSANTPLAGKTSTLLNWYEEGTFTPNQGAGLTLVGAFSSTGKYTRIGRQVSISGTVTGATSVAVTAAGVITSNLPFTVGTAGHGGATNVANNASATVICTSTSVTSAAAIAATATITFSATYFV